jgi:dolichyl-diphosphooligosaccharide--protein glycosyltransferase
MKECNSSAPHALQVTAMVLTFYTWNRALRSASSWPIGALAGLAYVYMVAAWGGYTFVINMVGLHAAVLLLCGRFTPSLYKAYTLFFIIGTLGAIQIPVVGLTPLKSLEQIAPLVVFLVYQIFGLVDVLAKQRRIARGSPEYSQLRKNVLLAAGCGLALVLSFLLQTGHFGAISARVRGLFLKHTRTGNPLVDSVAEHQPTTNVSVGDSWTLRDGGGR